MYKDATEQFVKAKRMQALAARMQSVSDIMVAKDIGLDTFEYLTEWKPFWEKGASMREVFDAEHELKLMQAETSKVQSLLFDIVGKEKDEKEKESKIRQREKVQDLLDAVKVTKVEGYREFFYLMLNSIAFFGYLMGIVTYYYDDELKQPWFVQNALLLGMNNTVADWRGNLAGDLMWTVEPMVILSSPIYLESLKKKSKKVKAE
jgi:F0F1-type ATP synthase assembly protein I